MAGNYPDVPSWRMAYDRDGTVVLAGLTQFTSAQMIMLNNEVIDSALVASVVTLIFPELRDLDGYYVAMTGAANFFGGYMVETSVNSTNGVDGTWVQLATGISATFEDMNPGYRASILASTVLAIKAVRFTQSGFSARTFAAIHLFGEIAPAQNPNRLVLWHPTLDQRLTPAWFDWGNAPRSSSADKTFRVKNNSSIQTATSIRVAQEILTDTTPSVVGQHTLSTDATTFLAQVNVGNLAPGAISGVVTLRRVTPANAVMSIWCHRVFAEATSWTS